MRKYRQLCGTLAVIQYHGLDGILVHETERLKKRIALLEELEAELEENATLLNGLKEAYDAR